MCGRFTLSRPPAEIAEAFGLKQQPFLPPHYNIAPSQAIAVVIEEPKSRERQLQFMRWGLIPAWAKDPNIGNRLINARSETVMEKPAFRSAFQHRRCLIVADGFYEWQSSKAGKQPFYFHLEQHRLFAFAGLWERSLDPSGTEIASCTILTTSANQTVSPVHNRMPVILEPQAYDLWLDPDFQAAQLLPLLQPLSSTQMEAYPVSDKVNEPTNDSPECIRSLEVGKR